MAGDETVGHPFLRGLWTPNLICRKIWLLPVNIKTLVVGLNIRNDINFLYVMCRENLFGKICTIGFGGRSAAAAPKGAKNGLRVDCIHLEPVLNRIARQAFSKLSYVYSHSFVLWQKKSPHNTSHT